MADNKVARRLSAIVAADVAGYSRLMGADEEGTLAALKSHRRELIDPKIGEHGGRIVKSTGDGLLVEFPSVVDAVRCWLDVQQGMLARNDATPVEQRIQFRVGINLGDVISDDDDLFGDGVNIAARLETTADPGGICISQAVLEQVKRKLDLDVEDLGAKALKNIEEPVRTYRLVSAPQDQKPIPVQREATSVPEAGFHLPQRPSLAILPFRNLNGDPSSDFIADGIGLGIQTLLVQLSGLFLINATFHERYRAGDVTATEALQGLPVRYVLEGAVQHAGPRVRVTAQLTDIPSGAVIWADSFDRELEDVFALQDDVTREVVLSLSSEFLWTDLERIWIRNLSAPGAWEIFLRGISHFYKFTKEDNAISRQMAEKIQELHPDKVMGAGQIAITYWLDAARGWSETPEESMRLAAHWAQEAIKTDEGNNGLGYAVLGSVRLYERRFDEALALSRKALSFRANCPFALGQMATVQDYCGDAPGAVKTAREALSVRLIYPPPLVNVLAMAYRDSGDIGMSIPAAREATRLDPAHTDAFVTLCSDFALSGESNSAHQVANEITEIDPAFRVSAYFDKHPYKDTAKSEQIADALRSAGLPD